MTTALINTSGSGTWTVPANCPAGTTVLVEGWGGGGGGGSRSSGAAFGSGGGGGGYVQSTYYLTPNDITNGVPYVVAATAAGGSGGDGTAGNNTTFSNNNLNLLTNSAATGASLGAGFPTAWTINGTPLATIVGFGPADPVFGLPYIDVHWSGTTASTHCNVGFDTFLVSSGSTAYAGSAYIGIVGGSATNITSFQIIVDDWTSADAFLAAIQTTTCALTHTLTRFSGTGTTASNGLRVTIGLQLNWSAGLAINLTLRIAGAQIEAGSSATAFKSTPGYLLAPGGSRSNGLSGGAGGTGGTGNGTVKNTGGAGAAYNAAGSGGGGSAGPDGAGNAGTTAGVGGQGDATTGGAGGAVSTTSPGNAGTANVSGGGGGGGLTTVGGTGTAAGAGGAPGGGGGGAVFFNGSSNSTGGAGAIGQLRITYYVTNAQALSASDGQTPAIVKAAIRIKAAAVAQAQSVSKTTQTSRGQQFSVSGAQSPGLITVARHFQALALASGQSVVLIAQALHQKLLSTSDGQSLAMRKSTVALLSAGSAEVASIATRSARSLSFIVSQTGVVNRTVAVAKAIHSSNQQATAANPLRSFQRSYSASDAQSSHLQSVPAHGLSLSAANASTAGLRRAISAILSAVSTQVGSRVVAVHKLVAVFNAQTPVLSVARMFSRLFSVGSGSIAFLPTVGRTLPARLSASTSSAFGLARVPSRSLATASSSASALNRGVGLSRGVYAPSTADLATFDHQYIPLAQRSRVVRLPAPQDISTLPPATRRVLLPREEGKSLDYAITQAEPAFFSPFDPSDQDVFTFDWTNRAYANDAIISASVTSIPAGVNFLGPAFITGPTVDITIGPFTPLQLPATYSLRCMCLFASGRISSYSVPFVVKTL